MRGLQYGTRSFTGNAEYAVNNVKYQVSASFQTPDGKIHAEDFADKLKRLILSEDIMNRSGKK